MEAYFEQPSLKDNGLSFNVPFLLIAVFSMILSINNFVKDKENEIAMLRTIGYSQTEILESFFKL
ncbi:MAG: hypothetical protein CM15mP12_0980 [Gammaproteobacteria bacterium]|nr:MAG: hypothetical protein CM15mP12_0980 [Gammaproteobacteria bacterium]